MKYLFGSKREEALEYIEKAVKIANNSSCARSRCGSIIVNSSQIIGSGFNSPPKELENQRRCLNDKKSYNPKITDKTCCIHAEQRAIMDALKNNFNKLIGSRLYFIRIDKNGILQKAGKPYCTICSKMALDVGISEFVLFDTEGICVYTTIEYNNISFNL